MSATTLWGVSVLAALLPTCVYVLILWWDISSYVAVRDLGGKAVRVNVTPGTTLEVGLVFAGS